MTQICNTGKSDNINIGKKWQSRVNGEISIIKDPITKALKADSRSFQPSIFRIIFPYFPVCGCVNHR